jgi:hypothetical protein
VAETPEIAEFVAENRFQIVGFGIGGQAERNGEVGVRIAGIKIGIGIENLSRRDGNFAGAKCRRGANLVIIPARVSGGHVATKGRRQAFVFQALGRISRSRRLGSGGAKNSSHANSHFENWHSHKRSEAERALALIMVFTSSLLCVITSLAAK